MKSLFFGLLLINLGVYAWFVAGPGQIRGQYAGVELPTPPAGVASLRLLDEQTERMSAAV